MSQVTLSIPDESLRALRLTPAEFANEIRLAGAMKLYEIGRMSSGAAARLAGIPRVEFLARLAEFGIDTFRLTREDLLQERPLA